jgi:choice-of-anchor C domain-containing protein
VAHANFALRGYFRDYLFLNGETQMLIVRLIASLAVSATLASATLLVNGSFELGGFTGCSNGAFCRVAAGNTAISGWQVGGVAVDWHNNVDLKQPHTGSLVVDLHLDGGAGQQGTLAQSFATAIGQSYLLTFYLAGPGTGLLNPRQVIVSVAGVQQTFSTPASSNTNMQWGLHTLLFNATSTTTTLTFSSPANGAGFWGPVLDSVSVDAVPEPSTFLLAGAGLVGFAWHRRRR